MPSVVFHLNHEVDQWLERRRPRQRFSHDPLHSRCLRSCGGFSSGGRVFTGTTSEVQIPEAVSILSLPLSLIGVRGDDFGFLSNFPDANLRAP